MDVTWSDLGEKKNKKGWRRKTEVSPGCGLHRPRRVFFKTRNEKKRRLKVETKKIDKDKVIGSRSVEKIL